MHFFNIGDINTILVLDGLDGSAEVYEKLKDALKANDGLYVVSYDDYVWGYWAKFIY